jgi:hypothetical protein
MSNGQPASFATFAALQDAERRRKRGNPIPGPLDLTENAQLNIPEMAQRLGVAYRSGDQIIPQTDRVNW